MAQIKSPKQNTDYPDRKLDLEGALECRVQATIADANAAGWGTEESFDALASLITNLRQAYDEDPDPSED